MTEFITDFDEIRASMVVGEYKSGKRFADIKPEQQIAQWIRLGLYHLQILEEAGQELKLTGEDIRQFEKQGGTDHLDPTLHSMGKLNADGTKS